MRDTRYKFRFGFTIVELVITIAVATVLVLAVGVLLASGHRAWRRTYDSAHKKIKVDALTTMLAFGSMGRRSNRISYTIYETDGTTFTPAVPVTAEPEEVVSGDAVEFRYWDVGLDSEDSQDLMDVTKTATAYALFYLDDGILRVDYGPYPPGAIPVNGGGRNTSGVTTRVLAENVTTAADIGAFSHTTVGGKGQGSVRINITITDPEDNESIKVMTATLMRNMWPR